MMLPEKPRLLLIGNFLSASLRSRTVSEDLAVRLAANGWDVQTTSTRRARLPRLVDFLATAWRRRNSYDVAIVDVYSGAAFIWAEAVCTVLRVAGKSFVLALHGGNLPEFARSRANRVARLLRSAAAVVAPSRFLLEQLRPLRADIQLIPNALELERYAFRERSVAAPRIVWLRSFHAIYNPTLAPRALALIAATHPEARLLMIGTDTGDGSFQATRAAAESLGVADRVEFPGGIPKTEVPTRLQEGDVLINTTNIDNTPVSVLEAMACGLCVVSTSVGGIPYLLADGVDALLVPRDDATAMASAVSRIVHEPALARSLSRSGRAKVESFDWGPVLESWERILTSAAPRTLRTANR